MQLLRRTGETESVYIDEWKRSIFGKKQRKEPNKVELINFVL